jgi:hypothetical protein
MLDSSAYVARQSMFEAPIPLLLVSMYECMYPYGYVWVDNSAYVARQWMSEAYVRCG